MPSEKPNELTRFDNDGKTPRPGVGRPRSDNFTADSVPNRRRHVRFHVDDVNIVLRRAGLMTVLCLGLNNKGRKICDLSKSGARILVTERLAPREKVRLKITLEKYQDELELAGEVCWCRSGPGPQDFIAGILFSTKNEAVNRKMNLIQEWFTSHQYRSLHAGRRGSSTA